MSELQLLAFVDIRSILVFLKFLINCSERQFLWGLCLVVFRALTLEVPIQTSLSVAPELPVSLRLDEKCQKFRKLLHPRDLLR